MSVTRKTLRQTIARRIGDYRLGTATGGTTTTLLDSARTETTSNNWTGHLYITSGALADTELDIISYTTGQFTFAQQASSLAAGVTYELWSIWRPSDVNEAINIALRNAYPAWFTETIGDKLVVCEEKLEYTLPTMTELLNVYIERCDEYFSGTATSGSTSSLTDSTASWTTNAYAGWHCVIYDGTGAGQYALVASNTATSVSLTTTGYNWTVAPDTTSKYMLKDELEVTRDKYRLGAWYTVPRKNPTTLYLTSDDYVDGMYIRLHYISAPAELTTDAGTTDVPVEYIVNKAMAELYLMRTNDVGFEHADAFATKAAQHQALADRFAELHHMRYPPVTMRRESETWTPSYPSDWPF